ncbi:hypothetical protein BD324DRAFT_619774 [Kockovaella imperatae]|uniref:RRM domain-containing protein n=1 Tax=Kockovaella imperatae TaxID=4999 RepID=A0A1Y1UPL6_9TREE|nr:hypothetical protein BD324DRAFT_619774 [Kockovaella imperatae]ORX39454.1 hypothetical protein BD324DRAFT_619774 [Kockovaella imperatae]
MDVDKSLDDLIADKKTSQPQRGGRGRGGPRSGPGRAPQAPYARPPPRSTDETWVHDAYQGPSPGGRRNGGGPQGGSGFAGSPAGTGVGFTGISPRIEVVGLHYEVTTQDLKNIFSQAGTLVQGPTIRYDRSGRSRGEATMEFASYQQARIAINKFDGAMTKGQTISIRLLPPPTARPGPGSRPASQTGASLLQRMSGPGAGAGSIPRGNAPRGSGRGAPRGRGAPANRGRKGPANAGDLDKELDSFMTTTNGKADDVDMA